MGVVWGQGINKREIVVWPRIEPPSSAQVVAPGAGIEDAAKPTPAII